nr:PAS domain-containing protein [Pseudoduganella plicata]
MTRHAPLSTTLPDGSDVALSDYFDGHPVPTFAINTDHVITQWNRACEHLLGWSKVEMVGTDRHWQALYRYKQPLLADLIVEGGEAAIEKHYAGKWRRSAQIPGVTRRRTSFRISARPVTGCISPPRRCATRRAAWWVRSRRCAT